MVDSSLFVPNVLYCLQTLFRFFNLIFVNIVKVNNLINPKGLRMLSVLYLIFKCRGYMLFAFSLKQWQANGQPFKSNIFSVNISNQLH